MNNLSYVHRRLVMLVALNEFVEKEKVTSALTLWSAKYAESTLIEINDFIYELKNTIGIDIDFEKFIHIVNQASFKTTDELLEISDDLSDDLTQQNLVKDKNEISLGVFNDLISEWQGLLSATVNDCVKIYVIKHLDKQDFNVRTSMFFLSLFSNKKFPMKVKRVESSDLKKIVSLFYVGCCNYVNPIDVDRLLNQVTQSLIARYDDDQKQQLKNIL